MVLGENYLVKKKISMKKMSSESSSIQMHPISSTSSIQSTGQASGIATTDNNVLNNNQNSNSSSSIGCKANVSFVSDCPITDPGQSGKVRNK